MSRGAERRSDLPVKNKPDQRLHRRYPIALKVEYKVINKGRVERIGTGQTLNISSGGIFFQPDTPLPGNGPIELVLDWPFLLDKVCGLKLVMRGRIVRRDTNGIAIEARQHEFRTFGARSLRSATAALL